MPGHILPGYEFARVEKFDNIGKLLQDVII